MAFQIQATESKENRGSRGSRGTSVEAAEAVERRAALNLTGWSPRTAARFEAPAVHMLREKARPRCYRAAAWPPKGHDFFSARPEDGRDALAASPSDALLCLAAFSAGVSKY